MVSHDRHQQLAVVAGGVSLYKLAQGLLVTLKKGFLDFNKIHLQEGREGGREGEGGEREGGREGGKDEKGRKGGE